MLWKTFGWLVLIVAMLGYSEYFKNYDKR